MNKYEYLSKRYRRIKRNLRICLGIQQLIFKPYLNALLVVVLVGFILFWKNKTNLYTSAPKFILPIWQGIVHIFGISAFIFLLVFIIYMIGELTARRDEGDLIIAFREQDLRNGCPILMKKKQDKETRVTIREFYSNIPLKRWKESKDEIADSMDVHFVKPDIEYGGKNKDNEKRIVLYTAKGRKSTEREVLYDEE